MAGKRFACANCGHKEMVMTEKGHLRCPRCGDLMIVVG